jgi:hypothetical protein
MADDATQSALTHGAALLSGGGLAGVVVRALFGGISDRLDRIEKALEARTEREDKRHDELIGLIAEAKRIAEAAHNRLDIFVPKSRRRG